MLTNIVSAAILCVERGFMMNGFVVDFSRNTKGWTADIYVDGSKVDTVFADNLASLSYLLSGRLTHFVHTAAVTETINIPTLW